MPAVSNPFGALDNIILPALLPCPPGSSLVAYSSTTQCANDNFTLKSNPAPNDVLTGGVYFISGTLTLKAQTSISGTGLLVLLPGASIDTKGGGTITITGNASLTTTQLPSVFQNYASSTCGQSCLLDNLVIYDQSKVGISMGGKSNLNFSGNIYAPGAAVTFQGTPSVSGCGELIAASIAFSGDSGFDNRMCSSTFHQPTPSSQYVALVQ
jgi:hypothetical protein